MSAENPIQIHATGEATGFIPAPGDRGKPITVIGTNSIRAGFDATCLQQALNARSAPGVTDLVLNPDAHAGYGAPVGCVLTSPTHIYPGPVLLLPALSAAREKSRRTVGSGNLKQINIALQMYIEDSNDITPLTMGSNNPTLA